MNSKFVCDVCDVTFSNKSHLRRHQVKQGHGEAPFAGVSDARAGPSGTKRMLPISSSLPAKRPRVEESRRCEVCAVDVLAKAFASHLRSNSHKEAGARATDDDDTVEVAESAFKTRIVTYRLKNTRSAPDFTNFLKANKTCFFRLVQEKLKTHTSAKINLELFGLYTKMSASQDINDIKSFNTKNAVVTLSSNLAKVYDSFCEKMLAKSEEFQERESGWTLKEVLYLEININQYNPLRGSSYIQLPKWIRDKKAVINIKNGDGACFAWSIVAALQPETPHHSERISSYPHYRSVLNLNGLTFPMEMKNIGKFEELNNMSVNVFGLEGKSIVGPLHFSVRRRATHVNLLYIQDGEKNHFCWIKNLSRLVGTQLSKQCKSKWLCDSCLVFFRSEDELRCHMEHDCNHVVTSMPTPLNNKLEFTNVHKQLRVPFVIYADFESILKPVSSALPDKSLPFTNNVQEHEPFSFAYYIKCSYDENLNKFELYRGPNAAKVFMEKLKEEARRLGKILKTNVSMIPLEPLDELLFYGAVVCSICKNQLGEERVRDHDHLTGKFRGAAHNECNIKYKVPHFIPVVLHNLSGYDSHFIVKELGLDKERVTVVPNNKELYVSFTKQVKLSGDEPEDLCYDEDGEYVKTDRTCIQLRFIDSLRFMSSSLDKLAKNLELEQFVEIRKCFPDDVHVKLLTRKGVFPYSYIKDSSVLNESSLPPKEAFYNNLTFTDISFAEYGHAQKVWKEFNIRNLGEYSDLYLKTDVLLLTDIFENFRNVCMKTYDLDPCQYLTAPSLTWDAMLKYTRVQLELFTDIDMHHFIKRGIRGGLVQCSGRYAKANNKYMPNYDPAYPSKYLTYLDANNLYGWAMSQYLPINGFRWMKNDRIEDLKNNILNIPSTSNKGYILEVDLEYLESLHSEHNDMPFCPENTTTPYPSSKTSKLIASLENKTKYVIHYRNLQQCLRNGLKLTAVHRVIEFNQSPWLKSYIDLNTSLRTAAKNAFEKDFFKLMNNAIFGKTMENVDKRVDVKIVTQWEREGNKLCASVLIAKPNFNSNLVLDENLVIIQMDRVKVTYDKPIYAGFAILDLSKTLMYGFHYEVMKPMYGPKLSLLYTDTDSLIYSVETDNFYRDIAANIHYFDTSDYPLNNKYNMPLVNKKVVGKFKDECNGDLVLEFLGSRAKSYCLITETDIVKKIKGISRNVVNSSITPDDFKEVVINNGDALMHEMVCIRSKKHQIYTQLINKVSLSGDDDKRFTIPNSTSTYAWGHNQIDQFYFT